MSRHAERLEKFRHAMRKEGVDAFLVADAANVTYLTGFTGDSTYLLVSPGHAWLITDGRYTEQAATEAKGCEVVRHRVSLIKTSARLAKKSGATKLGFEPNVLTVAAHEDLTKEIKSVEAVAKKGLVEKLRQVKDKDEIARIRAAVKAADAAFLALRARLAAGLTEAEAANGLEFEMRRLGARKGSFDAIVAAGARSSLPHARATQAVIAPGSPVLVDWGVELDLYCSDCTRVLFLGPPSAKWRRVYEAVRKAQARALAAIRPGVPCKKVDGAARRHIRRAGYASAFKHSLGHGVGLRVHEGPTLSAKSEDTLREGMVVTVEPGIYLPGWGGVRIEDLVVVRRHGAELLSSLPKTLEAAIL
ncbi:MAG: aminopeptidase P family protein [Planctomycetes bacterium]|nr:aminopeptidase P family protein [Planctomycetota bacterium]